MAEPADQPHSEQSATSGEGSEERAPAPSQSDIMAGFVRMVERRDADVDGAKREYNFEFLKIRLTMEDERAESAGGEFACTSALRPCNAVKNRYRDIVPYDKNRVVLGCPTAEDCGDPDPSYVNASFIENGFGRVAFIASQGPTSNTLDDFWRMALQCSVDIVLMLCSLVEGRRAKCERYWPNIGDPVGYANARITLLTETVPSDEFIVRTMTVATTDANGVRSERVVHHYQYTSWPDYGRPDRVEHVLDMLGRVGRLRAGLAEDAGGDTDRAPPPMLVHCSAGCGRTGAVAAIVNTCELMRARKLPADFSLVDVVLALRRQRIAMVQSIEQYILVHHVIAELFRRRLKELENEPLVTEANGDDGDLVIDVKL